MTYKDLQELTGQESGIIMFADNKWLPPPRVPMLRSMRRESFSPR